MPKPDYDHTIARIAGNILSGHRPMNRIHPDGLLNDAEKRLAQWAVELARAIVAEVKRTTPQPLAGLTENRGNVGDNGPASARSIDG